LIDNVFVRRLEVLPAFGEVTMNGLYRNVMPAKLHALLDTADGIVGAWQFDKARLAPRLITACPSDL
jgi:hypothetical protein